MNTATQGDSTGSIELKDESATLSFFAPFAPTQQIERGVILL
jgi:hypothetical protein